VTRVDEAFAVVRAELAAASLAVAIARDNMLTTPELIAKLDVEPDPEGESNG
jgi:hypothetical protein